MTTNDTRKDEGLKSLGAKTEYRMDYAPEVLETFVYKQPFNLFGEPSYNGFGSLYSHFLRTIIGCVSTVLSLLRCAPLRGSRISQKSA